MEAMTKTNAPTMAPARADSARRRGGATVRRHGMHGDVERIDVRKMVEQRLCTSLADAARLYGVLETALREGREVLLSFAGIRTVLPAFLGVAIGDLYGKFDEGEIKRLLRVVDMNESTAFFLEDMVKERKLYLKDPKKYNEWHREFMRDIDME